VAYVIRGGNLEAATAELDDARDFVEGQLARHPESLTDAFGVTDGIKWAYTPDALECRNSQSGAVLFTIRPVADP
jgi:hypothetical protein